MASYDETKQPTDGNAIQRETPEVDPGRAELVKTWSDRIRRAKDHWDKTFKLMQWAQRFVRGFQWEDQTENDPRYRVNLALRHIRQRTAEIYAKNPTAVAKRRPRLDFMIWDGKPASLQAAVGAVQEAAAVGAPPPPEAAALLADVYEGKQRREMLDRTGKTLALVFNYSMEEQRPRFKTQAKQLVIRARTCKVGYIKLAYQRVMGKAPASVTKIDDFSRRLMEMEVRAKDLADQELQENEARAAELRAMIEALQKEKEIVLREGLIFDFPAPTALIVDPACKHIKGFVGAHWLAEEMSFTTDEVKGYWNVDLGTNFTAYSKDGKRAAADEKEKTCRVWILYDLDAQLCMTLCDGYPDFLAGPGAPDVWLEQFHPYYALTFNDIEDESDPYPPSDVELIAPMCVEMNRSREGLREHRIANRPGLMGPKGMLSKEDKEKLGNHEVMEYVELDKIGPNNDVKTSDKITPIPKVPIDPSLYDTEYLFTDMQRVSGRQEANFGGTSNSTATEVTVAENTRASDDKSDIDELDEFFTDVARGGGQILLTEMSKQTVVSIAGDGAAWPELSRKEIAAEVLLEVKAGSSGKPNQQADLAKLERATPLLTQLPGISPMPIGQRLADLLDMDVEALVIEGLPSITMVNGQKQPGTGDPASSPGAQGEAGKDNRPAAPAAGGTSTPAFPATG